LTETLSTLEDVTTPALLLDLDAFEANISRMASFARSNGVDLRPHAKTHKCPEIAHRQIEAGAIGISGCHDQGSGSDGRRRESRGLLITSELTSKPKIDRMIRVLREAPDLMVVVDNSDNAKQLSDAALAAGLELAVLLDVDPGFRRTGVSGVRRLSLSPAEIMDLGGLRLRGVHCYSGSSAHVLGFEARREHSLNAMRSGIEDL
jgi:D-serine deaminase-like pyridoxal phosphate-dependent protein